MYDESNDRHTATNEIVECAMRIWATAGMKAQLYRSCIRKLETLWIQWKDISKQKTGKDDKRREGFSRKMDSLSYRRIEQQRVMFIRSCQAVFLLKRGKRRRGILLRSSYGAKGNEERHEQEYQQDR